jgi:hypothetical protein
VTEFMCEIDFDDAQVCRQRPSDWVRSVGVVGSPLLDRVDLKSARSIASAFAIRVIRRKEKLQFRNRDEDDPPIVET